MANPYQLLIFDWDGTLMDSIGRIIACLQGAITALQLETRPPDELRHVIGLGMPEAILQLYPQADEALIQAFTTAYRERFLYTDKTPAQLFTGVPALLDELAEQGYWLAIATGKSRVGLDRVLEDTGLQRRFLATRCADESFSKPHPQMLESIFDELGVAPADALMVGDSHLDLLMAANAGAHGLGVTSGVHDARELSLHQPLAVLNGVAQLPVWLGNEQMQHQPLSKDSTP
ncbi:MULTISPECIES: HAD-IIIA family hydrolase [unclassified Ectothiorhodospira]|uniref:HAD-IIIA family hydrolase n=1 Tax=unclassified Ectothiorhodospira TaxID=2684909 RepID=UPI001EE9002D|nr:MULTISPECIES: HAD-IIIA family hydrolase [unclassified Ectothiorhodospira]MCG5514976.1 HAD-IIIA family hydrolase [Ectothiorhodospira sp. 9100]MCG5517700.1 HAD-IIIA family hydrolase [Ectothiorhodospira sp. 9905]